MRLLDRLEQRDHRLRVAHAQLTVGFEQRRLQIAGLKGADPRQFFHGVAELRGLVARDPQIEAYRRVLRLDLQRALVFLDGLFEASEAREHDREIGEAREIARLLDQEVAPGDDGRFELPLLLKSDSVIEGGERIAVTLDLPAVQGAGSGRTQSRTNTNANTNTDDEEHVPPRGRHTVTIVRTSSARQSGQSGVQPCCLPASVRNRRSSGGRCRTEASGSGSYPARAAGD